MERSTTKGSYFRTRHFWVPHWVGSEFLEVLWKVQGNDRNVFNYSDDKKVVSNHQVGHMLRTKLSDVNEGGVAAGLGALDSVFLVDVERCCENVC